MGRAGRYLKIEQREERTEWVFTAVDSKEFQFADTRKMGSEMES